MGKIGFTEESSGKVEDTFEEIKNFVRNEVTNVQEFKRSLSTELKKVDDLLNNLLTLAHQAQDLERMAEKRNLIFDELIKETNRRASEIDIAKCDLQLGMIRELDNNLSPMVSILIEELQRLFVEETHILFKESEENQKVMHEIDKHSRYLINTVQKIKLQLGSTMEEVNRTYSVLEDLRVERAEKDKNKIGF
ncbi:hypothetical protein HY837_01160 [archaeon]|nr:hypothetical protein [archaeon]